MVKDVLNFEFSFLCVTYWLAVRCTHEFFPRRGDMPGTLVCVKELRSGHVVLSARFAY